MDSSAAITQSLIEGLPPLSRLALAYAPAAMREDWLTLLALDARLAAILRQAREPMLAQLRLAWWRDHLTQPAAERPKGEPLLARLAVWGAAGAECVRLVDGWEALLGEPPLSPDVLSAFADGRAAALAALADRHGSDPGKAQLRARRWALADLAVHSHDPREQALAAQMAEDVPAVGGRCERAMRPLAILEHGAITAGRQGAVLSLLATLRIGLLGL